MFAETVIPFLTVPYFAIQSKFDNGNCNMNYHYHWTIIVGMKVEKHMPTLISSIMRMDWNIIYYMHLIGDNNKKKNRLEEENNKQPIMDYSYTVVSYILFINWNRVMSIFILMIVIMLVITIRMRTVLGLAFHDAHHHTLILLLQIGSNHGYLMIILLLLLNMTMKEEEEVLQLY